MQGEKKKGHSFKLGFHYLLAVVLFLHAAFFLIYWFAVGQFRNDVDQFLGDLIAFQLPFVTILMVLTVLVGVWSFFRMIGFRLARRKGVWKPSPLNWIFLGLSLIFLAIFYASYYFILQQEPAQRGILIHLLNLVRLISDAALFLWIANGLRRLILFFRKRMANKEQKALWVMGVVFSLLLLIGVWILPALFPPNWAYEGDLPAKPAIIAHRGASMLAPENTLAAIELASVMQAMGFETDIRISLDGVPFLMHDATLQRTTNVAEVYPDRVDDPPSSFEISELKNLNAGLWFLQSDPFGTINAGLVSQTQLSINQGQKVPTLSEALTLVEDKGLVFLFDIRYPPSSHPFYDSYFETVFEVLRESQLDGNIWFLLEPDQLPDVMEQAPQMTRVVGLSSTDLTSADELVEMGYEIVNVDVGISHQAIESYRSQGLGVNVYTVDEIWLFSQFWLTGVTSVTTNNVHTIGQLNEPFLAIPYSRFLLIWSILGIIMAIWLAASQPEPEETSKEEIATPDLLDFASEEDETIDTNPSVPPQPESDDKMDMI